MASESEQGHVGCTAKRRTRLARPAFVGRSVKSLTNSNRRIRNRTYGGVGGADERLSPLSRSRVSAPRRRTMRLQQNVKLLLRGPYGTARKQLRSSRQLWDRLKPG